MWVCDFWAFSDPLKFSFIPTGLPPNCSSGFSGKILEAKSRAGKNKGSDELEG
ncbi:hypothetical protein SLEP1_g56137 [Rubroshorea leprosula]|uniref:Uncharacterized protein n=1 Tax=Rubroshorea leprosula TaxID=152421 RepID=A0AAV5MKL5_9ROSI|nr:hypothetical protein SLEP1_g56137 [Rubroshorea leprosula]